MSQFAKTDASDYHAWETVWLSPDYTKTANTTDQFRLQRNTGTGKYRLSRASVHFENTPLDYDSPIMNEQMLYDLFYALRNYLQPYTPPPL